MSDNAKYSIYYKNNKFQQIRGFCNVVIFDGISNAARQMGLTQSAVSHQIGSLEEDLKLKLFTRVGNKMVLTKDGKRFYDYVIPTLKQMDNIYDEFLSENNETKENELRIAGYHSAIVAFLPFYISSLLENNPEISVTIENISKDDALIKLRSNEIDLMFYPMNEIPEDLMSLKLVAIKPTLVVSKKSKLATKTIITPEDLVSENILLVDNFQMLKTYNLLFDKYKIKSRINFVNANWEMIRYFTKYNIGCSFYGDINHKEQDDKDDVISIDISNLFPTINYHIVSNKLKIKRSVQIFFDLINNGTINYS